MFYFRSSLSFGTFLSPGSTNQFVDPPYGTKSQERLLGDVVSKMTTYGKRSVPDVHQEPGLWIAGLGTQYPRHLLRPESLEAFAERFYDSDNAG